MVFDTTILGSNPSAPATQMKKLSKNYDIITNFKNFFFPFYKSKEIKIIFEHLERGESKNKNIAMFVGGCVRKFICKEDIDDIDIATILTPEQIKNKFLNSTIKVIDTGIEHGSLTIILNNLKFEITTLRKDIKSDGRHAEISYSDSWEEDSKRRDFTINAIYMDKKGKYFDPQNGINDLKNRLVKFIGDPSLRIEEDFLRIIRFIRFSLYYNSISNEKTIEAIKLHLNGIKNISKERILNELIKILNTKNFRELIYKKNLVEIFSLIFPEFKYLERFKKFDSFLINKKLSEELLLGIMLLDESNNHEYFCHKYKTSNTLKDKLSFYKREFGNYVLDVNYFKKNLKKNIYLSGKKNIIEFNILMFFLNKKYNYKTFLELSKNIEETTPPNFPYDGKYLIKKGFKEGRHIGSILKKIEESWINADYFLDEKNVNEIINKYKN